MLYRRVHEALRPLHHTDRQVALDAIASWAGVAPSIRATHRTLTADEVAQLASGAGAEIGAHTLTHADLSECESAVQETEIVESKNLLEALIGRRVESFGYPFGLFSPESAALVQRAGFTNACTTIQTSMRRSSDRYLLPRIGVPDCNGEAFEPWLRRCFLA
jgi:peptidoglycan/xylan/chitin deacetylase (PgdA/CDA1 family)